MSKKHTTGSFENKRGLAVEVRGHAYESAIRTFGKKVKQEGLLREVKDRQFYEKPSEVRRRRKAEAISRYRKAQAMREI